MAKASATLGIEADLSPLQRGMRNASDLVRRAFRPRDLDAFNQRLAVVRARVNAVGNALTSVRSVVGAVAAALAFRQGLRVMGDMVRASRELDDALARVRNSMGAAFSADRLRDAKEFARTFALATGTTRTATLTSLARFQGAGFDDAQSRDLTRLTTDVAAQFRVGMDQAAKLVQDAASGRTDGLRRIGIDIANTGDAMRDAVRAIDALRERSDGAAAGITNSSEALAASMEDIKATLGDKLTPHFDDLLGFVRDALTGWSASSMAADVAAIREFLVQTAQVADKAAVTPIGRAYGSAVDTAAAGFLGAFGATQVAAGSALMDLPTAQSGMANIRTGAGLGLMASIARQNLFAGRTVGQSIGDSAARGRAIREQAVEDNANELSAGQLARVQPAGGGNARAPLRLPGAAGAQTVTVQLQGSVPPSTRKAAY